MAKVNQNFVVYALVSSEKPDEIRYIGQAVNLKNRIYNHRYAARKGQRQPVYDWMRSVKERGFKVMIRVLVRDAIYNKTEQELIAKFKATGLLLNLTDGGEGALGRTLSKDSCQKIAAANTGKKRSPEVIENYRKWRRSWTPPSPSPASREKMRAAKVGKPSNRKGMKVSQESKERMRAAWILRKKKEVVLHG